jgi:transcriptional regulator with XRE-family HTH domain
MTAADLTAERHWICARRLRERRRQLGLTQADVVTRLAGRGAALSNRALSAMENGRGLDLGRLPDLAAALGCTVTYLIGLTAEPARWEPDAPLVPDAPLAPGAPQAPEAPLAPDPPAARTTGPAGSPPPCHNWILGPGPPWSGLRSAVGPPGPPS